MNRETNMNNTCPATLTGMEGSLRGGPPLHATGQSVSAIISSFPYRAAIWVRLELRFASVAEVPLLGIN